MANRDVFAKALPNIKLSTKLDAEGKEIQVSLYLYTFGLKKKWDSNGLLGGTPR